MDVPRPEGWPQAAARPVPDLRPAADAAVTARQDRPPAALAPTLPPALPPPCASQRGHALRGLLGSAAAVAASQGAWGNGPGAERPPRALKPWGVVMLPSDGPERSAGRGSGTSRGPAREAVRG